MKKSELHKRKLPWLASLMAIPLTIGAFCATYRALSDFAEERLLETDFAYVSGQIVSHEHRSGRGSGTYLAKALYSVKGKSYYVVLEGGGTAQDKLPIGASVDVKYSNSNPAIADATALNAETVRWTPLTLVVPWSLAAIVWISTLLSWAESHSQPSNEKVLDEVQLESAKGEHLSAQQLEVQRQQAEGEAIIGEQWRVGPSVKGACPNFVDTQT